MKCGLEIFGATASALISKNEKKAIPVWFPPYHMKLKLLNYLCATLLSCTKTLFILVKPIRAGVNPSTNTSTPIPTIRGGGGQLVDQ
jgi:hypothetical protein